VEGNAGAGTAFRGHLLGLGHHLYSEPAVNQWALIKNRRIINVVTTAGTRASVAARWPTYEVKALESLPQDMLDSYQYWNERP
jgi:hypothetical protein